MASRVRPGRTVHLAHDLGCARHVAGLSGFERKTVSRRRQCVCHPVVCAHVVYGIVLTNVFRMSFE